MTHFRKGCGTLAMAVVLCSAPAIRSQAVTGTLLGTVTDSTNAAVGNAQVTITATDTGQVQKFTTNSSGNYTVPNLPPGNYTVLVEASGFKRETHEHIDLVTNSSTRVDFALSTGAVTDEILVSTAPPTLQTDRADISTKLERQAVNDLPLGSNRNFQSLLNLVPGTTPATFQHSQFFNAQSALQTQANGIPRMGNLYQIEGIDDDERTGLLQIIIPPAEAIQSVDVSTNNFDAELGRAIGAVTNVTLRSGSNAFHGSAFEFIQNNATNARSYFATGPLGHLAYNYFGGTLGGPIIRDKLFIFGDYLRTTDRETVSNTLTTVPTQFYTDNGSGFIDLSAPSVAGGTNAAGNFNVGQVYDPATGNPDGSGRTPFAGNRIPIGRVNAVALGLLRRLPAPNQNVGTVASPSNNYFTNLPFSKNTDSFDIKSDWNISSSNHLSGRYSYQRVNTFQAPAYGSFIGGPAGGGFQGTGTQSAYSTGANFTHVFSNNLFTEARVGVAHLRNVAQPSDYGTNDATTAGIPGANVAGDPFSTGQVGISLGSFSSPLVGYSASMPWIRAEANIDFVNNWSVTLKNHTVKFGADYRRVRDDLLQNQTFSPRGLYNFGQNQTSVPGASTRVSNEIASLLLDVPSSAGRDLTTFFPAYRQNWLFAFVADKWQVNQKLTLDLGVRWEFYPPATPRVSAGFSNYDPDTNQLRLAGVGSVPANLGIKTRYSYFAPRTGLSFRATDTTVLRAGFGMSYMPFADNVYAYNYPVRANNSFNPATTYGAALLPDNTVATFQKGFPAPIPIAIPANGIIQIASATSAGNNLLNTQSYTIIPTSYYNPYVMSWNVAVQQAFAGDVSLQLAYVANHGVHMPVGQNINLPNFLGGGVASEPLNIKYGRTASTTAQFLGFSSNYQSLQAQLTKRFARGLGFTTAFTWGKALNYQSGDDGGLLFFAQLRRNYARADYDRAFNYEQSVTYELPVGRNHKYLSSGPLSFVLGGWRASAIISAVSGSPFTVNANGGALNTPGVTQTANLVAPYRRMGGHNQTGIAFFDPASFGQPTGAGVVGNTQRNQFRGPGFIQNNVSIFKSFPVYRESVLDLRLDAFQLSNTPQFANPQVGTFGAGNFGYITGTVGSGQGSVNGVGGGRSLQASVKLSF